MFLDEVKRRFEKEGVDTVNTPTPVLPDDVFDLEFVWYRLLPNESPFNGKSIAYSVNAIVASEPSVEALARLSRLHNAYEDMKLDGQLPVCSVLIVPFPTAGQSITCPCPLEIWQMQPEQLHPVVDGAIKILADYCRLTVDDLLDYFDPQLAGAVYDDLFVYCKEKKGK